MLIRKLTVAALLTIVVNGTVLAPRRADAADSSADGRGHLHLGMNLSAVNDWNREWVFVDVFKQSRAWISQQPGGGGPWDTMTPIELGPNGWPVLKPGQAAATLMCRDLEGHYPPGRYVCTYQGRGEIAFGFDARVVAQTPGRIELDVAPTSAGILLRIDSSDPADPIRDIHITMPGMEDRSSPFHPLFVERLKPFKVIRFMDWGATNNSTLARWSERTLLTTPRQSGPAGVAYEHMIDLCNELQADPWICIPHLADDDFIRQLATLVRERLNKNRRIYVEWSNEAWNGMFSQARWVQEQAKERRVEWPLVIAAEAARDWAIWREAFSDAPDRVVRVAAGQQYNPWVCETLAKALRGQFDAISCAAYITPEDADLATYSASTSPEEILRSAMRKTTASGLPMLAKHQLLAKQWSRATNRSIPLVIYEGGQHFTAQGQDAPYAPALLAAQTHPLMAQAYGGLLDGLRKLDAQLFVAFNYVGAPTKWGSWGHLTYQDEPLSAAHKMQALLNVAEQP